MMLPGWTDACPASRVRTGPAIATAVTVVRIRIPAASAASPPAIAVVATEAISHGAMPTAITPSRSGPAATTRDSACSTVTAAASAPASGRQVPARRRSAPGRW
jgi:hypothetical protein